MNSRGQVLPLAIVMVLTMALGWVALINAGKLIKDRIQMQIAADTAAQTACAYRARALNITGVLNGWLGTRVAGIGYPQAAWWPTPGHPMGKEVARQSVDDLQAMVANMKKFAKGSVDANTEAILAGILRGLMGMVRLTYDTHPRSEPVYALKQKEFIETVISVQENYVRSYGGGQAFTKAQEVARAQGADGIYVPKNSFSLGLLRNRGPVWYLGTLHIWHAAYKAYPWVIAPFTPINENDPPAKRWYERGPHFDRKAMRLYAFRQSSSPFNGSFPMGRSLLPVKMPTLYSVAAARVYNPAGPMFPRANGSGGFDAGVPAAREYDRASNGWHAQLTPVGGPYVH